MNSKKAIIIAVFSRFFLLVGVYLSHILYGLGGQTGSFLSFLTSFAQRWDGPHYLFIAQHGYAATGTERFFIVFPPLYPFLVGISDVFLHNMALTAIIVSNILFVLGSLCFYKLLRFDYSEKFSLTAVFLLSVFSTSYFFSTSYAESLFFFLCCGVFLLARQEKYSTAAVFAGMATLTKPFGLILWPVLLVEWWQSRKKPFKGLLSIFSLIALSTGVYLLINYLLFADFFAFQKFLTENWYKSFAFPWQGMMASWKKGVFASTWTEDRILVGLAEALTATISWLLVPIGFRKLRTSYFLYYLFAVVLFTSTGFILSGPRYLLSIPPFFIILACLLKYKPLQVVWVIFSTISLFFLTHLFATGHWAF